MSPTRSSARRLRDEQSGRPRRRLGSRLASTGFRGPRARMDCPGCGRPNPSHARFCGNCGAALLIAWRCSDCGAANPAGQRFCNACGQATAVPPEGGGGKHDESAALLGPRADVPEHLAEKIRAGRAALEGERKQVTVLFADVKGSMELAEQLRSGGSGTQIMERFFAILTDGVHRFEGTVNQFTGDGIMALVRRADRARGPRAARLLRGAAPARRAGRLRGASCAASRGSASRCAWASTRARWSSARSATTCAWTTPRRATPSAWRSAWSSSPSPARPT